MADNNLGDLNSILHIKTDPSEIAAAQQQLNAIFGTAQQGLNTINDGIAKIQKVTSLGILGGGLAGIVHQVFQTRSYFQDAASSMKTFLGDADKAAKFTKELQDYAFYNMFEFQDLVGVSKQLIAYGTTDTKEIIKVTDQLSNIATGTGANINEMVYIYNKIKAQGRLQGDELNQLASRGLVVKDVLKEMGETVNGNNVTFEQFQKVLTHVTSEGGMFHDLMKDQLNNLSASAAQLSDNMTNLWNTVGETLEPVMKEAIDLAGFLIEKGTEGFESIQAYLFDIAKAYGIYKVVDAGMSWNAENKEQERAKSVEKVTSALEEAAEATKNIENADLQAAVAKKKLTAQEAAEVAELRKRVAEENKAKIASGELTKEEAKKIAATKEGLKLREIELKKVQEQSAEELAAINAEIAALEKKIAAQKAAANAVGGTGASGISAETAALKLKDLEQQKHNLTLAQTAAAERQAAAVTGIATIQQAQNTAALAQNEKARGILARGMTAAGSALKSIGSSIVEMINPTGMLIAAVGFLAEHLWEVYKAGSATEQAQERLREAQDEAEKQTLEEMQKLGEYAQIIRQSKEDTDAYKEAKEGLWDMANKLNIQTTETVDGIKQEMTAIDLINKKYDEYKEKIRQVANEQAFQAYVKNERQVINDQITDVTSYLREEMEDLLLDGLKGDEWGTKKAEISAAITDIGIQLLEGNTMLTGKTKELYDEYIEKLGGASFFSSTYWKNIGKTIKREFHGVEDAISGDGNLYERNDDESLSEYVERTAKGYGAYLMQRTQTQIDASNATIIAAKKAFNIHDEEIGEGGDDKDPKKNTFTRKILKAREDAKKYIEEYAKLAEEQRKAIRAIDVNMSLDEDERSAKKSKVIEIKEQEFKELAAKYEDFTKQIADKKYFADILDKYGIAIDASSNNLIENLENAYENAANSEIEIARQKRIEVTKEIAAINKQINQLQAKDDIDPKTGNVKKRTQEEESAINASVNMLQQRIAMLTAISEGYEQVINKDKDWERNFSRIHAITKQENDKFLDDQVKKQRDIRENYEKLRRELSFMFSDGQLTEGEYRQMSFQLDINEEKARQQEYINIYGGYYQKREELTRQWEQRLANVPPEYFNVAKQKMVEELSKMNFDQFKQNLNWEAIFGDLSKQTAKALTQNLKDLKAAFNAQKGSMGIEEIKTVTEAIAKLDDELNKRNPWRAIAQSVKEMKDARKNIPELEEKQKKAVEELTKAEKDYQNAVDDRNAVVSAIKSGIIEGAEAQEQLAHADEAVAEATQNLNDKEQQLKTTNEELNIETDKEAKAQLRLGEGWKSVGGYISEAGSALSKIGDALGEDGEQLKEIGDVMSTIGSTLTQTISSLGNPTQAISQAINATVQMVSNVIASRKKAKKEQEEWAKSQRAFITNMKLAEIEETRLKTKDSGNWVRDYVSEAADAAKAYTEAQSNLYKKMTELSEKGKAKLGMREKVDWGTVGKNTALGAGAGAAIGSIIPGIGTAIGAAVGSVVGAVGGFISGLFSKKNKKVWGDLMTQFPELIERAENGEERINKEMAEQLISQGMVNDATKEMIEDAMKYQDEMDKAREQIEEIADSLMGSLGNNLRSALVDAFVAGEDAAEALHKTVNATLEDMISQLLYGARLAPIFEKIKTAIADSLQGGGGAMEIVDIIDQYYGELSDASDKFTSDMATLQKYGDERGWDLFKGDAAQRNAVSGGIANVTQDTAEEMTGRLTQIQSHTFSINENMKMLVNMQTTQLAILQGIHTDTGQLHAIRADIASVKATVADIQIRGLKLKE